MYAKICHSRRCSWHENSNAIDREAIQSSTASKQFTLLCIERATLFNFRSLSSWRKEFRAFFMGSGVGLFWSEDTKWNNLVIKSSSKAEWESGEWREEIYLRRVTAMVSLECPKQKLFNFGLRPSYIALLIFCLKIRRANIWIQRTEWVELMASNY